MPNPYTALYLEMCADWRGKQRHAEGEKSRQTGSHVFVFVVGSTLTVSPECSYIPTKPTFR